MSQTTNLTNIPAAMPPPGQTTNFINPPSQQPAMITVSTVMMVLTLTFVSVRLYAAFRISRRTNVEDWICLAAMILSFAYTGVILDLSYTSRHMWNVPLIWFTEDYWKRRFAGNTIQAFAYFASRLPIFLLYIRLFGKTSRGFRIACYIGIAADFFTYLTAVPLLSYFCTPPLGGNWNSLSVFAKCEKLLDWSVIQGSMDIALDLYIFILPLPTIVGLKMPRSKKIGVLMIFLTGSLAVISSGVGFYYRYQLTFTSDVNWNEGAYICMAVVEINIAIICSCMPACTSLYKSKVSSSSFMTSMRSIFLPLTSKGTSWKQKYSDSYSNRLNMHSEEYVELHDHKGDAQRIEHQSHVYTTGGYPTGITEGRTLEVV